MTRPADRTTAVTSVTPWRGIAMALAVGMAFAANTTLAALAYRGGATPLAVLIARATTAFVVLFLLLGLRGVPRNLAPMRRRGALALGVIFSAYSFAVLSAIQYLPVGLVVATFYVFPILVGLVEWRSGRQPFNARIAMVLLIAFSGIVLATDVLATHAHAQVLGLSLTLLGAVGVTVVITLSARVRAGGDSRPVTLHMLGAALAVFVLIAAVSGGAALPHTALAWGGFIAGPLFYAFGVITLFVVMAEIGPVKNSLLMNIEPVTSVTLGYLVLDQHLRALQLVGIALVVGAVLLVESGTLRPAA